MDDWLYGLSGEILISFLRLREKRCTASFFGGAGEDLPLRCPRESFPSPAVHAITGQPRWKQLPGLLGPGEAACKVLPYFLWSRETFPPPPPAPASPLEHFYDPMRQTRFSRWPDKGAGIITLTNRRCAFKQSWGISRRFARLERRRCSWDCPFCIPEARGARWVPNYIIWMWGCIKINFLK